MSRQPPTAPDTAVNGISRRYIDWERTFDVIDRLVEVADSYDVSPAQAALAYLLHKSFVTSVIVGAGRQSNWPRRSSPPTSNWPPTGLPVLMLRRSPPFHIRTGIRRARLLPDRRHTPAASAQARPGRTSARRVHDGSGVMPRYDAVGEFRFTDTNQAVEFAGGCLTSAKGSLLRNSAFRSGVVTSTQPAPGDDLDLLPGAEARHRGGG